MNDYLPTEIRALLRQHCDFGGYRVYVLMAIARKKENPQLTESTEITFQEVMKTERDIRRKYSQLTALISGYTPDHGKKPTYRLYVNTNARNVEKAYWNFRKRMNSWSPRMAAGELSVPDKLKRIDSIWKSELQRSQAKDDSYFVFDLDDLEPATVDRFGMELEQHTNHLRTRRTPNGYHLMTDPFNYTNLETDVEYELKKDNLLYLQMLSP